MNTSQDTTITEPDLDAPITATATAPTAPVAPAAAPTLSLSSTFASPPPPQTRRISTREELKQVWLALPTYHLEHLLEQSCSLTNTRTHQTLADASVQKTEILKLRLSLANYKVKTGQVDVPLDRLQVRPVPGMTRRRTPLPSMSAHTVERSTPAQQWYRLANDRKTTAAAAVASLPAQAGRESARDGEGSTGMSPPPADKHVLPRLSSASMSIVSTPRQRDADEESLSSSALRGGAAKGLLSLSQGSVGR